ncbi:MAG: PrgI family protein [Patescibacteria group bacterium]|nr:PrgI family protein [Patescibacteria group bacterium]
MRFTVPQFIDVEDKIIGPITTRQFLILLVTAGIMFGTYKLITLKPGRFTYSIIAILFEFGFGGVLAFLKINGQPFHFFMLNLIQTLSKPQLRVWDKNLTDAELKEIITAPPPPPPKKRLIKERVATSRLSELTLVVNTGGVYNPDEV